MNLFRIPLNTHFYKGQTEKFISNYFGQKTENSEIAEKKANTKALRVLVSL
jgi:hypothetical protein